ncbi:MAG: DUF192 domain-containing protein [Proteobacteria bacterium]|nr:DUF192 domain-containing protein [Pseudomonadota bacterium]
MRRTMGVFGLFLALLMVSASGCEKMHEAAVTEGAEDAQAVAQQEGVEMPAPTQVALATVVINGVPFSAEIATTDEEKAKGLSGRESLPQNSGMWFVFERPVTERFWMQGMEIPLDLIFIDEEMKVVHVFENAVPGSTELISSPTPFMYVLEVNGGIASKNGIKAGDQVEKRIGVQ